MRKYISASLAGILVTLVMILGIGAFLYHEFHDYDIAAILQNSHLSFGPAKSGPVVLPPIGHVFVIVEENHDWSEIYNNSEAPFINKTLLPAGSFARNYHNVPANLPELHPSEPNYIFLESGMIAFPDHTFVSDNPPSPVNSTLSHNHLSYLLERNNFTWKSYQENIPGTNCPIANAGNYVPKHNPMVFFQDVSGNPPAADNTYCQSHVRPLSELSRDLAAGQVANYVFIAPNLDNDMHNGSIKQADNWLAQIVPLITNSPTFKKDGVLFITWDEGQEDDDKNNPIGMIVLSPFARQNYSNTISYSHASLVKTVEEIFKISPFTGLAGDPKTADLSDFFSYGK